MFFSQESMPIEDGPSVSHGVDFLVSDEETSSGNGVSRNRCNQLITPTALIFAAGELRDQACESRPPLWEGDRVGEDTSSID